MEVLLVLPLYQTEKMRKKKGTVIKLRAGEIYIQALTQYAMASQPTTTLNMLFIPMHERLKETEMLLSRVENSWGAENSHLKKELIGETFRTKG